MHTAVVCALLFFGSPSAVVRQQSVAAPEIAAAWQRLSPRLTPSARAKVSQAARQMAPSIANGTLNEASAVMTARNAFPSLGDLPGGDIEAIAFIVMMEASKSAQEDLKQIMDSVKSINAEKEKLRNLIASIDVRLQKPGSPGGATAVPCPTCPSVRTAMAKPAFVMRRTPFLQYEYPQLMLQRQALDGQSPDRGDLEKTKAQLKAQLDSLDELDKDMQMKMQLYQERMSKFMEMLSNFMMKKSDAAASIISNLK